MFKRFNNVFKQNNLWMPHQSRNILKRRKDTKIYI